MRDGSMSAYHVRVICSQSWSNASMFTVSREASLLPSCCKQDAGHGILCHLQTANFQAEIMRQQQQKKEASKRKRMLASRSRCIQCQA